MRTVTVSVRRQGGRNRLGPL